MKKMKMTLDSVLKRKKRIKLGRKGKKTILAAEWVDQELIENIKLRSRLSRNWRYARKNNLTEEIQEECKKKYQSQKKLTAKMAGEKKK